MKKHNRNNRKGLKKRLSAVMLIYMDSLPNKKKVRLENYLNNKLNTIVDYYFDLFSKKKRRKLFILPPVDEVELSDPPSSEDGNDTVIDTAAQGINQQQISMDDTSEQNIKSAAGCY